MASDPLIGLEIGDDCGSGVGFGQNILWNPESVTLKDNGLVTRMARVEGGVTEEAIEPLFIRFDGFEEMSLGSFSTILRVV